MKRGAKHNSDKASSLQRVYGMEERKAKTTFREAISPGTVALQRLPKDDSTILCEARQRIAATIDEKVNAEIKWTHEKEKELARKEDRPEPPFSHTIEMLLRKGLKTYKCKEKTE